MQYPPDSYGNYDQPTFSGQNYPNPEPPFSPPAQPAPKPPSWWRRQKRITKIGILGCGLPTGIVLLCLCSLTILGLILEKTSPSSSVAVIATTTPTHAAVIQATVTRTPASKPTSAPTKTPMPTATHAPAASGQAVLGGTLADFEARYGPLNSYSNPSQHQYYFSLYGQGKDDLTLQFVDDPAHVSALILDAPGNTSWNESDATSHCTALLPSDAMYERQMNVQGADTVPDTQRVYTVPSLESLFPASAWTDENGNQANAGTVGMILNHYTSGNGSSGYISCVVQVGLQST
jgi:hypothetical protein